VIITARIQADVSPERGLVSNLRSGHLRGSLRQRGQAISQTGIARDLGEGEAGPKSRRRRTYFVLAQALHTTKADQGPGDLLSALHIRKQVRTACQRQCISSLAG